MSVFVFHYFCCMCRQSCTSKYSVALLSAHTGNRRRLSQIAYNLRIAVASCVSLHHVVAVTTTTLTEVTPQHHEAQQEHAALDTMLLHLPPFSHIHSPMPYHTCRACPLVPHCSIGLFIRPRATSTMIIETAAVTTTAPTVATHLMATFDITASCEPASGASNLFQRKRQLSTCIAATAVTVDAITAAVDVLVTSLQEPLDAAAITAAISTALAINTKGASRRPFVSNSGSGRNSSTVVKAPVVGAANVTSATATAIAESTKSSATSTQPSSHVPSASKGRTTAGKIVKEVGRYAKNRFSSLRRGVKAAKSYAQAAIVSELAL